MDANQPTQSHTNFTRSERLSPRLKDFLQQLKIAALVVAANGEYAAVWWATV